MGGLPGWSDFSRTLAIAWSRMHAATCPDCGTRKDEWLDERGRPLPDEPYAAVPEVCPGCAKRDSAWNAVSKQDKDMPGLKVRWVGSAEMIRRLAERAAAESSDTGPPVPPVVIQGPLPPSPPIEQR